MLAGAAALGALGLGALRAVDPAQPGHRACTRDARRGRPVRRADRHRSDDGAHWGCGSSSGASRGCDVAPAPAGRGCGAGSLAEPAHAQQHGARVGRYPTPHLCSHAGSPVPRGAHAARYSNGLLSYICAAQHAARARGVSSAQHGARPGGSGAGRPVRRPCRGGLRRRGSRVARAAAQYGALAPGVGSAPRASRVG